MKAQLLFHIKSVIVLAASHVGCTRQLLNWEEASFYWLLLHTKGKLSSYSAVHFWACFYLNRDLESAAFAADVTHADVLSDQKNSSIYKRDSIFWGTILPIVLFMF